MLYSLIIGMMLACSGEGTEEQSTTPVQQPDKKTKQKQKKDQITLITEQIYSGGQADKAFASLLKLAQSKKQSKIPKEKIWSLLYYSSMLVDDTTQALAALEEAKLTENAETVTLIQFYLTLSSGEVGDILAIANGVSDKGLAAALKAKAKRKGHDVGVKMPELPSTTSVPTEPKDENQDESPDVVEAPQLDVSAEDALVLASCL